MPSELDDQLRALGRQLDAAAPPVGAHELADPTATGVSHLSAVGPDATSVIPLAPLPPGGPHGDPRRRRWMLGAAAVAAVIALAGVAVAALDDDGDPVSTDPAAETPEAGEPDDHVPSDPPVLAPDDTADAYEFVDCLADAGFTFDPPGSEGFEGFEALAEELTDPDLLDAVRACSPFGDHADLDGPDGVDDDLEGLEEELDGMVEEVQATVDCLAGRGWSLPEPGEHELFGDDGFQLPPVLQDLVDDPEARDRLLDDIAACTGDG